MGSNEKPQIDIPDGQSPSYQLEIDDIAVGDGEEARSGHTVEVHYVGVSWSNGQEFDASWDRGAQPFEFPLGQGQVIVGWDEGVKGMKVGGRRKLTIPAELAYGAQGSPPAIPPNEPLVFVIDLKKVG